MNQLTSDIKHKKCVPCDPPAGEAGGGVKPLTPDEYGAFLRRELTDWSVKDEPAERANHHAERGEKVLEKEYKFKNFKEALAFVNKVGALAEDEGHHPDIFLHNWNNVKLSLSTHAIGGLSENDFILASKIDEMS